MHSEGSASSRSRLLTGAAAAMEPAERRDFLSAVCQGDAARVAELEDTITMSRPALADPSIAAAVPLERGDVGERFQILRRLGEGGMGSIYEAFDRKLGARRALKFPKPGYDRRITGEARAALLVTHENICR